MFNFFCNFAEFSFLSTLRHRLERLHTWRWQLQRLPALRGPVEWSGIRCEDRVKAGGLFHWNPSSQTMPRSSQCGATHWCPSGTKILSLLLGGVRANFLKNKLRLISHILGWCPHLYCHGTLKRRRASPEDTEKETILRGWSRQADEETGVRCPFHALQRSSSSRPQTRGSKILLN